MPLAPPRQPKPPGPFEIPGPAGRSTTSLVQPGTFLALLPLPLELLTDGQLEQPIREPDPLSTSRDRYQRHSVPPMQLFDRVDRPGKDGLLSLRSLRM